jgi:hypothetical protein
VTSLLSDIVDDVKGFVDEDVIDRTRDVERDVRRTAGNWTDPDRNDSADGGHSHARRDGGERNEEIDELRKAIRSLAEKINALSRSVPGSDMPISGYDDMTAVQISDRLTSLSQQDLRKVEAYERTHADRKTVLARIRMLRDADPGKDAAGTAT